MSQILKAITDKVLGVNGSYPLPGGLIIKWARLDGWASGTSKAFTWNAPFPNEVFHAQATDIGAYQSGVSVEVTTAGGTAYASAAPGGAYVFALGR